MAERAYFFNAVVVDGEYDRAYDSADHANFFAGLVGNGIFYHSSDILRVTSASGMNVTVLPGKANINGYHYENESPLTLELGIASGTLNRIDRIVIRLDLTNRDIRTIVKAGVATTTPTPPLLTRTNDVWELSLGQVYVGRGIAQIVQSNIGDERLFPNLCGIVTGLIDQIDMSNLYAQQIAQFNQFLQHNIDNLSENAAGHLQNQINDLQASIGYTGATSGTAPNYVMTIPDFLLVDGTQVKAKIHQSATSATSLNINDLGAKPIVDGFGDAVPNLRAGTWLVVIYNGTAFQAVGLSSQFVVYS